MDHRHGEYSYQMSFISESPREFHRFRFKVKTPSFDGSLVDGFFVGYYGFDHKDPIEAIKKMESFLSDDRDFITWLRSQTLLVEFCVKNRAFIYSRDGWCQA